MADPRVRGLVETAQAGATLIAIPDTALFAGVGRSFLEAVSQPLR